MKNIAILASGSGTNAQNIIQHFQNHSTIRVDSVWSNRKDAYVLERAAKYGVDNGVFTRDQFYQSEEFLNLLKSRNIDLVVLAGFLWLVPTNLIHAFPIINIHPALLPAYGGKGMYGDKVHEAVITNREKESGITIHLVDEVYDHGAILHQEKCPVLPSDTPETLAKRIHQLEYEYFPKVIENFLTK
jgi:phosphoribosylglycinamide formyltransferase-1